MCDFVHSFGKSWSEKEAQVRRYIQSLGRIYEGREICCKLHLARLCFLKIECANAVYAVGLLEYEGGCVTLCDRFGEKFAGGGGTNERGYRITGENK